MGHTQLSSLLCHSVAAGAILLVLYSIGLAVQRLYLSPIAKIQAQNLLPCPFGMNSITMLSVVESTVSRFNELHDSYGTVIPPSRPGGNLSLQDP